LRNVYVVTHPQATHHVNGLVGGWFESDLTERGLAHAGRTAEALASRFPADAAVEVYSSDLLRARRTAEVVGCRLSVDVVLDTNLREKSYGDAEGRPQAWLDERFVPPPAAGERMRHDEGVSGAETRWDLAVRAYAALDRILQSKGEHQVVVTHGGTATFSPGGITVLRQDDRIHSRKVVHLNGIDHLT
jgi:probable phosphoglycerate mutase